MTNTKIAVIPARGGSKRIPRKNIKDFHGKPIISYAITAAIESGLFEHVFVSTDDNEIASIAEQYGATVPFVRPKELADDHSTLGNVLAHTSHWLSENGFEFSAICSIFPTSPFLHTNDLKAAYDIFSTGNWNYVFAATEYVSPIQRSFRIRDDQTVEMFHPEEFETRSQDLEKAYHDAGMFSWGTPEAWKEQRPPFSNASTIYKLPHYRVIDLDTIDDWLRAEIMYEVLEKRNQ